MPPLPREKGLDHTLSLISNPYRYIGSRCDRMKTDVFETRILLRRVVCMCGPRAAQFFYDGNRMTRSGAMPPGALRLLQDVGSVQLLDDEAHRHRKALFLTFARPDAVDSLGRYFRNQLDLAINQWCRSDQIVLLDEMKKVLTHTGAAWCGIPISESDSEKRIRQLAEMVEGAGAFGPRKIRALRLRHKCERWIRSIIQHIRSGRLDIAQDTPAYHFATFRDLTGKLLPDKIATVELLNLLRPVVAVAHFIPFIAMALYRNPEIHRQLQESDTAYLTAFAEEVRRTTPFFPMIGGRARTNLEWRGHHFRTRTWFLLDLYGTNMDPQTWQEPDRFLPDRFLHRSPDLFEHIPQGAGRPSRTHRCPGEPATIELLKVATNLLARDLRYTVPEQDLSVDMGRIPTRPNSGFVMRNISRQI